jgi:hypothetical protein
MAMLQLPYWLMIAGALLVIAGFVGVLVSRKKVGEADPSPEEPTGPPRQQMPPLPTLLDSKAKQATPSS